MKKIIMAALLLVGLAGCKTTTPEDYMKKRCDENRAAIRKTIQDPARQAAMLKVIDSFEREVSTLASDSTAVRGRYDAALRKYDTTPEQLKEMQAEMESTLERLCAAIQQHSLNLRKNCSEEEWKKITAHVPKFKNVVHL